MFGISPQPYIMPKMFSPRSSFTQVLATLLPICFAWVFVACVSICSTLEAEAHGESYTYHAAENLVGENGDEHCPITEATTYAPPERLISVPVPQVSDDVHKSFSPFASLLNDAPCLKVRPPIPLAAFALTLERLCILRI